MKFTVSLIVAFGAAAVVVAHGHRQGNSTNVDRRVVGQGGIMDEDSLVDSDEELGVENTQLVDQQVLGVGMVDLDRMQASIRDDLTGDVVGFGYVISKDGILARSGGGGFARRPSDGNILMTEHLKSAVASVSKTVTAVATLQLLETLGLSVNDLIHPWLPPSWGRASGIDQLQFQHLLSHTTGWGQRFDILKANDAHGPWGNDWDGIEFVVSSVGANPGSPYDYKNANFAVLRMIVPALWKASGEAPFEIDDLTADSYGLYFVGYIQDKIFEPAGVTEAGCWDFQGDKSAYSYDREDLSKPGRAPSNNLKHCGGHSGMLLSAYDLAAFMAFIRYDDNVLSPANRALMDSDMLGWSGASSDGKFWHGGTLFVTGGRDYRACVMKFPQNVEATLVINSDVTKEQCKVLRDAFDDALSQQSDDPPTCFSGDNTVEVLGKGHVSIASLKIGDYIRSSKNGYSQVYSFGHKDGTSVGSYLRIVAEGLEAKPLEISGVHLLYANNEIVRAMDVKVGDMLGSNKVLNIEHVFRSGMYAPDYHVR